MDPRHLQIARPSTSVPCPRADLQNKFDSISVRFIVFADGQETRKRDYGSFQIDLSIWWLGHRKVGNDDGESIHPVGRVFGKLHGMSKLAHMNRYQYLFTLSVGKRQ